MRHTAAPAERDESLRQESIYLIRREAFEFDFVCCHPFRLGQEFENLQMMELMQLDLQADLAVFRPRSTTGAASSSSATEDSFSRRLTRMTQIGSVFICVNRRLILNPAEESAGEGR